MRSKVTGKSRALTRQIISVLIKYLRGTGIKFGIVRQSLNRWKITLTNPKTRQSSTCFLYKEDLKNPKKFRQALKRQTTLLKK